MLPSGSSRRSLALPLAADDPVAHPLCYLPCVCARLSTRLCLTEVSALTHEARLVLSHIGRDEGVAQMTKGQRANL